MSDENKNVWVCVQCKEKNPITVSECQNCGFSFDKILEDARKVREPTPWFRIAGTAFAIVGLMILVRPWVFSAREPRNSPVNQARAAMLSLADAIEAYRVQTGRYPAAAAGEDSVNAGLSFYNPAQHISTFLRYRPGGPMTLTTPAAFIEKYPLDPFSKGGKAVFGYYNDRDRGYILFSPGPDRDYDLDPARDYDATERSPGGNLFDLTYDPTNGARSDGDIWIVKE